MANTAFNSVTKAVSANSYKTRNSATVFGAGNFTSGNITNDISLMESAYQQGRNNGLPIVSTNQGRAKALSAGTFAYQAANKWVMLANSVTATLSGVSNTALASGAAQYWRRSIHYLTRPRTAYLAGLSWTATDLCGPLYVATVNSTQLTMGTDVAAQLSNTSRSGAFYMVAGKTATKTNYSNLNLW